MWRGRGMSEWGKRRSFSETVAPRQLGWEEMEAQWLKSGRVATRLRRSEAADRFGTRHPTRHVATAHFWPLSARTTTLGASVPAEWRRPGSASRTQFV